MQEGKYKVLMYVFLGLFIIAAGFGGYFGLFFYYSKKAASSYQAELTTGEQELENYNKKLQENSVYGKIKSVTDDKIVIDTGDGKEQNIDYSSDTKLQKLQEDGINNETYTFVDASKSDLIVDKEVWIIVDENNKNNAILIKISTS